MRRCRTFIKIIVPQTRQLAWSHHEADVNKVGVNLVQQVAVALYTDDDPCPKSLITHIKMAPMCLGAVWDISDGVCKHLTVPDMGGKSRFFSPNIRAKGESGLKWSITSCTVVWAQVNVEGDTWRVKPHTPKEDYHTFGRWVFYPL